MRRSAEFWKAHVMVVARSGQTLEEYAGEQGLKVSILKWWRSTLRDQSKSIVPRQPSSMNASHPMAAESLISRNGNVARRDVPSRSWPDIALLMVGVLVVENAFETTHSGHESPLERGNGARICAVVRR